MIRRGTTYLNTPTVFNISPLVPLPTGNTETANKQYVDNHKQIESIKVNISNYDTDLVTGLTKVYFDADYDFIVSGVTASLKIAPSGSSVNIDIKNNGISIFDANKLIIDENQINSITSITQPTIINPIIIKGNRITFEILQVGSITKGQEAMVGLIIIQN
jgi:hypothetical protein